MIDGDHNYFTVSEELRLIGERAPGAELPLLLFHDVCWPHGRRDDYFDPEQIPADEPPRGRGRRGRHRPRRARTRARRPSLSHARPPARAASATAC